MIPVEFGLVHEIGTHMRVDQLSELISGLTHFTPKHKLDHYIYIYREREKEGLQFSYIQWPTCTYIPYIHI
jgi:hypothetical protein